MEACENLSLLFRPLSISHLFLRSSYVPSAQVLRLLPQQLLSNRPRPSLLVPPPSLPRVRARPPRPVRLCRPLPRRLPLRKGRGNRLPRSLPPRLLPRSLRPPSLSRGRPALGPRWCLLLPPGRGGGGVDGGAGAARGPPEWGREKRYGRVDAGLLEAGGGGRLRS